MIVRRTSFIARLFKEDDEPIIRIDNTDRYANVGDSITFTATIISPARGTANFTNASTAWTPTASYTENPASVAPEILASGTSNIKVTWQFFTDGSWVDLKTCSAETNPGFFPHPNATIADDDNRVSSYDQPSGVLTYKIGNVRNEDFGNSDWPYRVYVQGSVNNNVTYPYLTKLVSLRVPPKDHDRRPK